MKELEDRIRQDGIVKAGNVLKAAATILRNDMTQKKAG